MELRSTPLFNVDGLRAFTLEAADVPVLQRFFEANPEYFLATQGRPPLADEAQLEFDDVPPAGMAYGRMWTLGFAAEASEELVGMATLITDFIAQGVGHIGLFITASAMHGSGRPHAIYAAIERWMREQQGAQWLRLGVVQGNAKPERFWSKQGYVQVRERGPIEMGLRSNLLRVMVKPLAGGALPDYLAMVARDRPGAP